MKKSLVCFLLINILLLITFGCSKPGPTKEQADERLKIVESAINASIEGAKKGPFERIFDREIFGDKSQLGNFISNQQIFIQQFDWSTIDMNFNPAGPVFWMIEQAKVYEKELEKASLAPLRSGGFSFGTQEDRSSKHVHVKAAHTEFVHTGGGQATGSGHGGYLYKLPARELVHWRIYASTNSAATLFVRMGYNTDRRILTVEFYYSDKTNLHLQYPYLTATLSETIDEVK